MSYRYFCLSAHYRTQMSFSWESLEANNVALGRLYQAAYGWGEPTAVDADFYDRFLGFVNDDLNLPRALALSWDLVKSDLEDGCKKATLLAFDQVFGLDIAKWEPAVLEIPEHISKLADERQTAREDKNWQLADEIRDELLSRGYEVEDTRDGPRINKT